MFSNQRSSEPFIRLTCNCVHDVFEVGVLSKLSAYKRDPTITFWAKPVFIREKRGDSDQVLARNVRSLYKYLAVHQPCDIFEQCYVFYDCVIQLVDRLTTGQQQRIFKMATEDIQLKKGTGMCWKLQKEGIVACGHLLRAGGLCLRVLQTSKKLAISRWPPFQDGHRLFHACLSFCPGLG